MSRSDALWHTLCESKPRGKLVVDSIHYVTMEPGVQEPCCDRWQCEACGVTLKECNRQEFKKHVGANESSSYMLKEQCQSDTMPGVNGKLLINITLTPEQIKNYKPEIEKWETNYWDLKGKEDE